MESITNNYKTQNQQGEYAGTEPFFSMYFDDIVYPNDKTRATNWDEPAR